MIVLWLVVMAAAALAAINGFFEMEAATTAPQQAVAAATAVAFAVIPYCFARAIQAVIDDRRQDRIVAALEALRTVRACACHARPTGPGATAKTGNPRIVDALALWRHSLPIIF